MINTVFGFFVCFLKYILLIMLLQLSHFFLPFISPLPCTPTPTRIPQLLSSCPWFVRISSPASPFPILFLTSPCLFVPTIYASYSLYLFSHSSPSHCLLVTLHVISISVVLFLLQWFAQFAFVFVLGVVVNNCEFAVLFTVSIFDLLFLR